MVTAPMLLWTLAAATAPAAECEAPPSLLSDLKQLASDTPAPAAQLAQLRARLQEDPDNLYLWQALDDLVSDRGHDYQGALARERAAAAQHPDAPQWSFLAARLVGYDQPASAAPLYRALLARHPTFARAHLLLSRTYRELHDAPHAASELSAYRQLCPQAYDGYAELLSQGSDEMAARAAVALRAQLLATEDRAALENFGTLWKLELKGAPPDRHPAIRQQIAADLARLRAGATNEALVLLLDEGYTTVGDAAGRRWVDAQQAVRFDGMQQTFFALVQKWMAAHPWPDSDSAPTVHAAYRAAQGAMGQKLLTRFPHEWIAWRWRISALSPSTSTADVRALIAAALAQCDEPGKIVLPIAALQEERGIDVERVPLLLAEEARRRDEERQNRQRQSTRFAHLLALTTVDWELPDAQARAAAVAHDRAGLRAVIDEMGRAVDAEALHPTDMHDFAARNEAVYFRARSYLAAEDNHAVDAVMLLLRARALCPELDDNGPVAPTRLALGYWKAAGGTDEGWSLLQASTNGRDRGDDLPWKKRRVPLLPMALHDLNSHLWTTQELKGKAVLVVAWATWCGPCKKELPLVQKLYERLHDRQDLLLLSFNLDEDRGQVQPFITQNHYTFPVLLAEGYMTDVVSADGIPSALIIDPHGVIRSARLGLPTQGDWATGVISALENFKP